MTHVQQPDSGWPRPEKRVYDSELLSVGTFRCPVDHPAFSRESVIVGGHLVVFPRTSVVIAQAGKREVVADPNVAVFYNDRQCYSRRKLSDQGDRCDFFRFSNACVAEAVAEITPGCHDPTDQPFTRAAGPVSARTYLAQRQLLSHAQSADGPDDLALAEAAIALLGDVLSEGRMDRGAATRQKDNACTRRRHRELVESARVHLAQRYSANETLGALARAAGCSEYHLCRVFRRQTGTTLSQYRNELRLRSSLERVAETDELLTDIALDLGYSSHSHFTASFRRLFAISPSGLRDKASVSRLSRLRNRPMRDKTVRRLQ